MLPSRGTRQTTMVMVLNQLIPSCAPELSAGPRDWYVIEIYNLLNVTQTPEQEIHKSLICFILYCRSSSPKQLSRVMMKQSTRGIKAWPVSTVRRLMKMEL